MDAQFILLLVIGFLAGLMDAAVGGGGLGFRVHGAAQRTAL